MLDCVGTSCLLSTETSCTLADVMLSCLRPMFNKRCIGQCDVAFGVLASGELERNLISVHISQG